MKEFINKHKQGIWGVFATSVFFVYSWSVIVILWEMPALLLRLGIIDIIGYVSYQFVFSLVESILISFIVVFVSFILPAKLMRDNLAVSGSLIVLSLGLGATTLRFLPNLVQELLTRFSQYNPNQLLLIIYGLWLYLFFLMIILSLRIARNKRVSYLVLKFLNRLPPLVSIYTILSICSIFIVLLRNVVRA